MKTLNWSDDLETLAFVKSHKSKNEFLFDHTKPQFSGYQTFDKRKLYPDINYPEWIDKVEITSPESIINAFQNNKYLEGLALLKLWGGMARTRKYIYTQDLSTITLILEQARQSIQDTNEISSAWNLLQNDLKWTFVMTSKTLHFLARSLGYELNPPAALDRAVILDQIWPKLTTGYAKDEIPQPWSNGLEGYKRYMTFINYFAKESGWSNTQYEATLFGTEQNINTL